MLQGRIMPRIAATALPRRRLDQRFDTLRLLVAEATPPAAGWIRAIRKSLGMTVAQLAVRLGVRRETARDIETSEVRGSITLDTLRRAAQALDCALVYALVPRESLEQMVMSRAREVAAKDMAALDHTMALEKQSVEPAERDAQIDAYVREEINLRRLWD
jgi:predicted DNA-binding mobile mystery protein A